MIHKENLIQKVVKKAGISYNKAKAAYETILDESPAFRKGGIQKVEAKVEKAVRVTTKPQIKKVELIKEVAVKSVETIEKIKIVEVKVPIEVIKTVEKIREIKVAKEVPVEVVKEVIKEVQVIKEVPIEVIKEITLIKEVEVPVEVIKEVKVQVVKEVKVPVVKEVKVKDESEINRLKAVIEDLRPYKSEYNGLIKTIDKQELQLASLQKSLNQKPKEVIKKVEVIKEVKVPVVKEVKIKDETEIKKLKAIIDELKVYKSEYYQQSQQITKLQSGLDQAQKALKTKPKEIIKEVKVVDQKALHKLSEEVALLKEKLKEKPKEIVKTIVKEVPVEVVREVEVVKSLDMTKLREMMANMKTKEVSKTVIGETRTEGQEVVVLKREVKAGTNQFDDLTKIEGIGPKIALLLNRDGIATFQELANTKVEKIKVILEKGGNKYQMHDPSTWPKQSALAAAGRWDDLKALQEKLLGGK